MKARICFIAFVALSGIQGFGQYFFDLTTELGQIKYSSFYALFGVLSALCVVASVRFLAEGKYIRGLSEAALALTFGQLLDELFFDPYSIQTHEPILFILAVLWVLYRFGYMKISRNG